MARHPLTAFAAAAVLAVAAGGAVAADPGRVDVVATVYPLAEWAQRVGGDAVAVTNLIPAGSDPHDFEPTPADLRRLREADVVLTLGLGFQPAIDRALRTAPPGQVRLVATEGLPLPGAAEGDDDHASGGRHDHGDDLPGDPHVWLDPVLAKSIVGRIADALGAADPTGAAAYAANARAYQEKLDDLHARYARTLASCAHRDLVTSHAAFGYLAARYGLHQMPIQGLSPEAEPTPRRLAELAAFVRRRGIRYVFTETVVDPRVAETLARESGADTLVLHTIETLSQAEIARGKTYLGVMEENLRALATGLGCRTP
ncbi:MAG TPA: zinc ABC transporter substrate-binding protein [Thermodesulfobacteriota bacterium]